ncbi:branched-chain amino acid ABC transporter permease [Pseudovibrio sp. Tun.PSC04-5.I4]|uniref:branched-chain amino acid ABC transporter permease n=1 Tax=Pseudovibrio sp. Tun.PSC04-5.I4 TaxID=1798213 RepID=UPI00088DB733|nr:branched-chain amino acid ABC transporter permease [Pseudovibrio sp. Tun.PSC04-5.I4]SDQ21389.1 branched-chain amino acid transport system permease protein [Pseudovibrio sp. Tun.PSC04-5.I4]
MIDFINYYLIPGITLGSIYALGAVGISMIFGILRFAHFAHGDLMTTGAYIALTAVWTLGIPALAAIPIAVVGTALVALLLDKAFYKPLRDLPTIYTVIASFGVALILRSTIQLVWGTDSQVYVTGFQKPLIWFDTFRIALRHMQIIAFTVVIAIVLHFFLTYSKTGKSMRAVSDDPELARIAGLDTEKIVRWTWIIGGGLAAIGGVFVGLDTDIHTNLGWNLLLPMFAAALLGGIGRPLGAMLGGLIIGIAEEICTFPIMDIEIISPSYKSAIAFVLMIALLLFRPQGLLKGRVL